MIGDVAQLVERGLCKPEVVGSIPIVSTHKRFVAVPRRRGTQRVLRGGDYLGGGTRNYWTPSTR